MTKSMSIILLIVIVFSGCKKDNPSEPPISTIKSGEVTVDTRGISTGFSFSRGDTISAPNVQNLWPDFEFFFETGPDGPQIIGVSLAGTQPDHSNRPTFHFKKSLSTLDSANIYFQNITEVTDSTFDPITFHLTQYQVYTVKTIDGKFAKILIRNNNLSPDSSYVTFSFGWVYQSNGTRHF